MIRFAPTCRPSPRPSVSRVIHEAQWPADHNVVRFIKAGEPDANGRQTFTVLWWSGEKRCGQVIHASLEEHLRRAWREGSWPEVVDAGLRSAA